MTSAQLRQSFLDFFASKGHTIVPSSPLLPDSPNLLFTNAGMNQFVPYFLGDRPAPFKRAADTQKCIRAGGKHNDLEDVGFDTYHHTFFEMLGNWSFGDYFKKESLEWGWELLTKVWGIPAKRLFATVYSPDKSKGDPADFDQEAYDIWAAIFRREGLDPALHIINGNKKDNFWMMGDTGPCGPCSEIHFNLLPSDDEAAGRQRVNSSDSRCIEIWNHVFIQFNAEPDGTFKTLSARHVDTGMGFERVAGIIATTKGFKSFDAEPSNYNADVFASTLAKVAQLSGKTYTGTVPTKREGLPEQEMTDVAFRVLADHARTVSCAIADGIMPGNDGRNYVIRRILRRGILYGRRLGLQIGFFESLVDTVAAELGGIFPELRAKQDLIKRVILSEEESFGRTLDRGLMLFNKSYETYKAQGGVSAIPGTVAFELYDTFGFPLDMTELLATERGLKVDTAGFEAEMEKQKARGRESQVKTVISVNEGDTHAAATRFIGFNETSLHDVPAKLLEVVVSEGKTFLVFDQSPFYAEMGGQVGDTGVARLGDHILFITNTIKDAAGRFLHEVKTAASLTAHVGSAFSLTVDLDRRRAIQRHHSATHVLNFALREVLGTHVIQQGSYVTPGRMRFDFAHFEAVTPEQLIEVEHIANTHILANDTINWFETEFDKKPANCIATFGEKYGKVVRVVDIGGWSVELCGGTHVRATGEIGAFKILAETGVAAGKRRIEAVAGEAAQTLLEGNHQKLSRLALRMGCGLDEVEARFDKFFEEKATLERELKALKQKAATHLAAELAAGATVRADGLRLVAAVVTSDDATALRELALQLARRLGPSAVVLGAEIGGKASLVAHCTAEANATGLQAGAIIKDLSAKLGGKGGGKPDLAMGGAPDTAKMAEAIKAVFG